MSVSDGMEGSTRVDRPGCSRARASEPLDTHTHPALNAKALLKDFQSPYAWCDIGHLTDDSQAWCAQVLAETGVALTPGIDFDPVQGHRFMRLSFCGTADELNEGLDRLVRYVG